MFLSSPPRTRQRDDPKRKGTGAAEADDHKKARHGDSHQRDDRQNREVRLGDLPCELIWAIATKADAADVLAMASASHHLAASIAGPLYTAAVDQSTLLRRLRLFVLCASHAISAGRVTAVRFARPFVVGDLEPRQCVMAIRMDGAVHWMWMTTRGDSVRYGDRHDADDLANDGALLMVLHRHWMSGGVDCVVTPSRGEEASSGSAVERALWIAVTGSCPPPDPDEKLQKCKGVGPCDRVTLASDVWARWSANPAAAEAFVREAALHPSGPKRTVAE